MGNTVGSLSQRQKSIIIGSLLGDAYLRKIPGRADAFVEINHSYKAKDYVDWKYEELKPLSAGKPQKREYSGRVAYRFYTKQHPELSEFLAEFYKNGRKIIPRNIKLDALSLAVWYMDDGSKTKKGDVYLNTQQFSFNDQRFLLHLLRQLGIRARMNKDKKYYRIRIRKESIPNFISLITPYIIPSMEYKLPSLTMTP